MTFQVDDYYVPGGRGLGTDYDHRPVVTSVCIDPPPRDGGISYFNGGRPIIIGLNLPGRDYKSIAGTNAAACRAACEGEAGKCLAWTYVQPGVQGPAPVCYLKDAVPEGRKDDCCTSGALDRSISVASH